MTELHDVLLRRQNTLFLPDTDGPQGELRVWPRRRRSKLSLLRDLEQRLALLGYLLSAELRGVLAGLSEGELIAVGRQALHVLAATRGDNVAHLPQFRAFPAGTPYDTDGLYIERVLRWLLQGEDAPCLVCGKAAVHALDPCGHLVCTHCFDGSNYSGCPICHGRINPDSPFLQPAPTREPLPLDQGGAPVRLVAGEDATDAALALAGRLLARQSPLSPAERDDLITLVEALDSRILEAAPKRGIPVRETKALVLGTVLDRTDDPAATFAAIAPLLGTATDVLRVLTVWMGGDAGLVEPRPRLRPMSRPLRRAVLSLLDQLPIDRLNEDMSRHRDRWLRTGEALRPFEYHRRYPNLSLAFASVRRSLPDPHSPLAQTLRKAAAATADESTDVAFTRTAVRVRLRSFAAQVEAALAEGALDRAVELLSQRPGELGRRFDHVLGRIGRERPELGPVLFAALNQAAPKLPTPLLLTLRSVLASRSEPLSRRVFFPRGAVTRAYGTIDLRLPLPAEAIGRAVEIITGELAHRAALLPPVAIAVIDESLADLLCPVAERTASKALVQLPRGSVVPLPDDERLRLFLHWTQPTDVRVDLDLSVALFDSEWWHLTVCDYTRLRAFADGSAIHSGDLTSAPAPLGASEFVDLDIPELRAHGVRHLAMIIFSYNDIAFETMTDAFAGFMSGRDQRGEVFDARTVEQRFDLTGDAKVCLPMLVDLQARTMRWVDVKPGVAPGLHSVFFHRAKLAHLCCDLHDNFSSGLRPTLYEVAALHAAGRADDALVRRRDGSIMRLCRRENESVQAFSARIATLKGAAALDGHLKLDRGPVFAALAVGDLELPDGSSCYALRPQLTPPTTVTQLSAGDLISALPAR
jgi:hypothetical protein